jgi:superfamily II DNA helicase RecQ
MLDYIAFLSCLEFPVLNSVYQNTILKPKQVICLENVYLEKDVMCVLPTGYGKSLIFHLLPMLLFAKFKLRGDLLLSWRSRGISTAVVDSIVIVVSPLNSLMSDQVSRLSRVGKCSYISCSYMFLYYIRIFFWGGKNVLIFSYIILINYSTSK